MIFVDSPSSGPWENAAQQKTTRRWGDEEGGRCCAMCNPCLQTWLHLIEQVVAPPGDAAEDEYEAGRKAQYHDVKVSETGTGSESFEATAQCLRKHQRLGLRLSHSLHVIPACGQDLSCDRELRTPANLNCTSQHHACFADVQHLRPANERWISMRTSYWVRDTMAS